MWSRSSGVFLFGSLFGGGCSYILLSIKAREVAHPEAHAVESGKSSTQPRDTEDSSTVHHAVFLKCVAIAI